MVHSFVGVVLPLLRVGHTLRDGLPNDLALRVPVAGVVIVDRPQLFGFWIKHLARVGVGFQNSLDDLLVLIDP